MIDTGEFLAQVLPLFLQFVGLPIAVGIGYYAYKNYYLPRQQANEMQTKSELSATSNDMMPPIDAFIEQTSFDEEEDKIMSDNTPKKQNLDTSDLPPLDMLLGELENEADDAPLPSMPDTPAEIVQLRKAQIGTQHVQLHTGQIAPAKEVLTILRDEDDGKLIIQVGNTAYRTLADDATVKGLFTQVMKELAGTITKPDSIPPSRKRYVVGQPEVETKAPSQSKPAPAKENKPSDVASIRDLLADEPDVEQSKPLPVAPPPPPTPDGKMPGDLPSYKLSDNPLKTEKTGRFSQKTEAETLPELDLAAAIETYLQYKLQHTPEYAGRQIHIHGTPSGTIRIQVDETYYDFVDEVAESDVRQFLQATIAEWQERQ